MGFKYKKGVWIPQIYIFYQFTESIYESTLEF